MEKTQLRFAIFGNEYQAKESASIEKVLSCLSQRGADISIDRTFYEFLTNDQRLVIDPAHVFEGGDFTADFVISMGGDGTFLKAASRVGDKGIPIIGVNLGRLGFLASVLPDEMDEMLEHIFQNNYVLGNHAVIQIETDGEQLSGSPYALNDIAILKRDNASMISIRTTINDDYLVTYQADGLIVSTPTGSTAYSLSNGGPIIVPQSGNICLTPVAPHSLNIRPIVLADDAVVTLSVESRSHHFLVAVDGRSEKLKEGTTVTIRRAPYSVRVVKKASDRYFSTLRNKMMWGVDQRE